MFGRATLLLVAVLLLGSFAISQSIARGGGGSSHGGGSEPHSNDPHGAPRVTAHPAVGAKTKRVTPSSAKVHAFKSIKSGNSKAAKFSKSKFGKSSTISKAFKPGAKARSTPDRIHADLKAFGLRVAGPNRTYYQDYKFNRRGAPLWIWDNLCGSVQIGSPVCGKGAEPFQTFFSEGEDGNMRIWFAENGEILGRLIGNRKDDWMSVTPEGFFDGSANGAGLIRMARGQQAYSMDQMYQALHRPDLVHEKLTGDRSGTVRKAATKINLATVVASGNPPQVAIRSAGGAMVEGEQVTVEAIITDAGGGIGKVEWRANDVTLAVDRGLERLGASTETKGAESRGTVDVKQSISLEPGENVIQVLAYNAKGLIASKPAITKITRRDAQPPSKPRLHVLAAGVNDYWDGRLRLTFAVPDAKTFADAMSRAGEQLYEGVEVTTVLDNEVTIGNLDLVFDKLAKKIRPEDVFVFFLAGHGKTVDGRYYFLPHDFRYKGDESIVEHGVGQDRWQEWFARIRARKSVLLYDTCESGALAGERLVTRGLERVAALDRLTMAMGRTVLTASTDDAPALEGYQGHGVFTYSLLEALARADRNGDGLIDVIELASYIDQRVPDISVAAFKVRQVPQMKIMGSNFPVTSVLADADQTLRPAQLRAIEEDNPYTGRNSR